jgi:hypothetical protein
MRQDIQTCLACGRLFKHTGTIPNQKGYCCVACVPILCVECGKPFVPKILSKKRRRNQIFCSDACEDRFYRKSYHGKEQIKKYFQRPEVQVKVKAGQREYQRRREVKARYKEYRQRPEVKTKNEAYHKEYCQKHKEEIKANSKENYQNHKTEILAHHKEYYQKHKEEIREKRHKQYLARKLKLL